MPPAKSDELDTHLIYGSSVDFERLGTIAPAVCKECNGRRQIAVGTTPANSTVTTGSVGFARVDSNARLSDEQGGFTVGIVDVIRRGISANEECSFAIGIDKLGCCFAEHGKTLSRYRNVLDRPSGILTC